MILNGVDIKRSCSTEVNINIQPFILLLYAAVNVNVHMPQHDFSVHIDCTSKSVTQRHAAVSIIQHE